MDPPLSRAPDSKHVFPSALDNFTNFYTLDDEASSLLLPILAKSAKKNSLDQGQSGNHGAEILKSEIRPEIHIKAMKIPHSVIREVAKREVIRPPPG